MAVLARWYDEGYKNADPRYAAWRDLGAQGKGERILTLIGGRKCDSLAEIGCGDGAVLSYIQKNRPGIRLSGFEIAEGAAQLARERGLTDVMVFDGAHTLQPDQSFDVVVLSHVLEHVDDPTAMLNEAARVANVVVGEVPLEDTLASLRPSYLAGAKGIGHIHKFSLESARWLLERSGLRVEADLVVNRTREGMAFWATTPLATAKANAKYLVSHALEVAAPRLGRLVSASNYAFLAVKQ